MRLKFRTKQISWKVWAELLRLPNLFTVPGDILVGWCLSGMRGGFPILPMLSSLCLYSAGLLWNDAFDARIDASERPSRPIPSGRVARSTVFKVASVLAGLGLLFAWHGFPAAGILLGAILFYDMIAKNIPWVGVVTMGCCRGLNVYLGAAATWPISETPYAPQLCWAMVFFTAYIVLVSVIAKHEANPKVQAGYNRFLAPAMTLGLIPLYLWFDRGVGWSPLVVAGAMALFLLKRHKVPVLVGALIRFLIPLQCIWCLSMYTVTSAWLLTFFSCCYVGAILASRRYAGS
jgi:hypothetical protein